MGDLDGARRLVQLLAEPIRAPEVRAFAHIALAHLALAEGRLREMSLELERGVALDSASGLAYRALLSGLPFVPNSEVDLRESRDALEQWRPLDRSDLGPSHFVALHEGLYPAIRTYLLATLSLRLGDATAAGRYLELLTPNGDQTTAVGDFAGRSAASVRAQLARHAGQHGEALTELDELLRLDPRIGLMGASGFHSRAWERFLYAETLEAVGRDVDARRRYNSFTTSIFDLIYLAPSHLRRARLSERLGAKAEAAAHYRRVAELWEECDPELRPLIDEARQRAADTAAEN